MVYNFFDKKSASLADKSTKGSGVNNEINQLKNYINQLLTNFKKEEFMFHLKTIFGFDNI